MASVNTDTAVCRDGVAKASEIFSRHGDFIYSVIRYRSGNNTQACDLFQDFFLSLAFNPPPADVRNIKCYLYRAIINDTSDAFRRLNDYRTSMRRYAARLEYIATKNKPENILFDTEDTDRMLEFIRSRLSPRETKAVTLRYLEGHEADEVAEKMSVDMRTVSGYIADGLSKVRRFLSAV